MRTLTNIQHKFNLNDLRVDDAFLGCKNCWWRAERGEVMKPICPECGNELNVYYVKKEDLKITKEPTDTEILEFLLNQFKSHSFNYEDGSYNYTNNKSNWVLMDSVFPQGKGQTPRDAVITAMRKVNEIQEFKEWLKE